jgi:hypothetical protein
MAPVGGQGDTSPTGSDVRCVPSCRLCCRERSCCSRPGRCQCGLLVGLEFVRQPGGGGLVQGARRERRAQDVFRTVQDSAFGCAPSDGRCNAGPKRVPSSRPLALVPVRSAFCRQTAVGSYRRRGRLLAHNRNFPEIHLIGQSPSAIIDVIRAIPAQRRAAASVRRHRTYRERGDQQGRIRSPPERRAT